MENKSTTLQTQITINRPVEMVWTLWTRPSDIMQWNIPFDNWHCPKAENNATDGGKFFFRMESQNGSEGFDYTGTYNKVIFLKYIESIGDDGRKTIVEFKSENGQTSIVETFEPENKTSLDVQNEFCQAVLNRFKQYAETKN